ncbi:hypothetical protein N0V90_006831 [Kalmusia sp. IMI 367209]|nr:hypothetical protein N0V90_006831 [Kalmusia sp. IMI 367209]
MTKFPNSSNAGYSAVSGEIFRWVKPVRQQIERAIEDCFQSFKIEELQSQKRIFNQRIFSTNDWLWSGATKFSNWLHDGKGLLWISGKPGSGKSTVMNHIARNLESKQDQCDRNIHTYSSCRTIVAKYFFDFSSSERARSAAAAFNVLIYQLLTNEPSLRKLILPVYKSMRGMRTDIAWDLEYLHMCLDAIIRNSRDFKFLLLIDALDESSMEPFDLAELLILLAKQSPDNLQLCVSSRPNVDFIDPFYQCPRVTLEDETGSDILQYVQSEFRRAIGQNTPGTDDLCKAIVSGSEGVFLWVKLVTTILLRARRRGEDFDQLKQRLSDFPNDLNAFYQRMLDDLDPNDQEEIRIMLAIVTSAVEPLTPLDLRYAVNACHGIYSDLNNQDLAARRVMAVSNGLLEIRYSEPSSSFPDHEHHLASKSDENIEDTARVHLAHETVKTFLYLKPDILRWTAADNAPVSGTVLLLKACIMTLKNLAEYFRKDLKSEFSRISDWQKKVIPFLAYSVKWWPLHAQHWEREIGQAPMVLRNFSPFEYNLWTYLFDQTSWMLRYEGNGDTSASKQEVRALRILYEQIPRTLEEFAVSLDLLLLARYLIDINRVGDQGSLLFAVAKSGNLEMAQSLIAQSPETVRGSKLGQCALCRAIYFGHLEIARLLLKHGADLEMPAVYWRDMNGTPLQVAVRMGNGQAIELLSEFGVNIDARDVNGSAAISTAVQQGDDDLVKLLIRCGATLNASMLDEKSDNALAAAIRSPTPSPIMITSLLEGGADPNLIPPHDKVPVLWNAVENCDIQAVKLLLGRGAKLNFVDERGHTILHKTKPFDHKSNGRLHFKKIIYGTPYAFDILNLRIDLLTFYWNLLRVNDIEGGIENSTL